MSERITRKQIDNLLDFARRGGLPLHVPAWSQGDRLGTRYQIECPEGHTVSRVFFGKTALYDALHFLCNVLEYQAAPKWVNGELVNDRAR